jgi:FSR family fosmidomycin resistance protein-like MFS transporter
MSRRKPSFALLFSSGFILLLLCFEFLDEFVFGVGEAAWPLIRTDLGLNYIQIGILLSLPGIIGSLVEMPLFILGDIIRPDGSGYRRRIILAAGGVFAFSLLLTALSRSFFPLLASFILFNPASGGFVSLSQASLMDAEPSRREQNMARWTFAGSLGVVIGPLMLGAAVTLGLGWRSLYYGFAVVSVLLVGFAWRFRFLPGGQSDAERAVPSGFWDGLKNGLQALRRREVLRWLVLVEFSNLMLDVLYGFLALYFVDVAGVTPAQASLGVAVWAGVGLLGDFLLIPLLERLSGLAYLRVSVLLELILFPAFLLAPDLPVKLVLLGMLGFFNSGWYAILQAQLYATMPGQSGTSIAVNNIGGIFGSLIPFAIGFIAQRYNLQAAMWLLLLGPLALWVGIPRRQKNTPIPIGRTQS